MLLFAWGVGPALAGCSEEQPAPRDAGGEGDGGGDADADGDGDRDGQDAGPRPPLCDETGVFWVDQSRGRFITGEELAMVVTTSTDTELVVETDDRCDPRDEVTYSARFTEAQPVEAGRLPVGLAVRAVLWMGLISGGYMRLRDLDGRLLWEGGDPVGVPPDQLPLFEAREDEDAGTCRFEDLAPDDPCCCGLEYPLTVWLVPAGEPAQPLAREEAAAVTIAGEPYVAFDVGSGAGSPGPCVSEGGGRRVQAFLAVPAGTEPAAEPLPGPGAAPCPDVEPSAWDMCETDPALECTYQAPGCESTYVCRGCVWHTTVRSGNDCPGFPPTCVDEGCSEESVCTDCSCPEPGGERWVCVWPGGACPPCG